MKKMKILVTLITIIAITTSCKKDYREELLCNFFELGTCFSTLSLEDSEVIISDNVSYIEFQDSIKRYFFSYCDTTFLPEIDFTKYFFIGAYSAQSGCNVSYNRQVFYNNELNLYEYEIRATAEGACNLLINSFNCAVVPRHSENFEVKFKISY